MLQKERQNQGFSYTTCLGFPRSLVYDRLPLLAWFQSTPSSQVRDAKFQELGLAYDRAHLSLSVYEVACIYL